MGDAADEKSTTTRKKERKREQDRETENAEQKQKERVKPRKTMHGTKQSMSETWTEKARQGSKLFWISTRRKEKPGI